MGVEVVLKGTWGLVRVGKTKQFDHIPDLVDLEELGEQALQEAEQPVREFDLIFDGLQLTNGNVQQIFEDITLKRVILRLVPRGGLSVGLMWPDWPVGRHITSAFDKCNVGGGALHPRLPLQPRSNGHVQSLRDVVAMSQELGGKGRPGGAPAGKSTSSRDSGLAAKVGAGTLAGDCPQAHEGDLAATASGSSAPCSSSVQQATAAKPEHALDNSPQPAREGLETARRMSSASDWEVKEILSFLKCDDPNVKVDDDTDKEELVRRVEGVQEKVLTDMLNKVEASSEEEWKKVMEGFLLLCMDSVNDWPAGKGQTFIHYAAHQGQMEALRQLVKIGAKWDLRNTAGFTPAKVAEKNGMAEAAKLLQSLEVRAKQANEYEETPTPREWKDEKGTTMTIGRETLCPRSFQRNKCTLFESPEDASFVNFSKISGEEGWDACAMSVRSGVTKIVVKFHHRKTSTATGVADKGERPVAIGLVPYQRQVDVSSWSSVWRTEEEGIWVLCETNAAESRQDVDELDPLIYMLPDVKPTHILTMELIFEGSDGQPDRDGKPSHVLLTRQEGAQGKAKELSRFTYNATVGLTAVVALYHPSDCISVSTEPFVPLPFALRHTIQSSDNKDCMVMLRSIILKLLPVWLKKEVKENIDRHDEKGHMMYVASLIVMRITRNWTKGEAQSMDKHKRDNYAIAFNHYWPEDLLKVLKMIWNNGGVPSLDKLRAHEHSKIPGSCKNKAVLALVLVDAIKPHHKWCAWTVWRVRTDEEAEGRFPKRRDAKDRCYCQLHCVNAHRTTMRWFDVIRFWDRDPNHRWPKGWKYPDPELLNRPHVLNFDLTAHTKWLRDKAAPGGKAGYSCPLKVPGVVPSKLEQLGVQGAKEKGEHEDEEDEEDEEDVMDLVTPVH